MRRRMMQRVWSLGLCVMLLCSAIPGGAPAIAAPAVAPAAAPDAAGVVELLSNQPGVGSLISSTDSWVFGGGFVYWAKCDYIIGGQPQSTDGPKAGPSGYLRRWPIRGGVVTTLSSAAFCNSDSWVANGNGLFYWENNFIYRRSAATPTVAEKVAGTRKPAGALAVDDQYLYYIADGNVVHTPENQTDPDDGSRFDDGTEFVVDAGASAYGLIVNGSTLNWFGGGRVRSIPKTCQNNCAINDLAIETGAYLSSASTGSFLIGRGRNPLWASGPYTFNDPQSFTGNEIRGYGCAFYTTGYQCIANTVYSAPSRNDNNGKLQPATIGPMATDGKYLFWVENLKICYNSPFGYSCSGGDLGRLMKYNAHPSLGVSDPFDTPQPIASRNSYGTFSIYGTPRVDVVDGWVYFGTSSGLSRIRADAPPLTWDLAWNGMEVTQGIQNLNNDVPLVANKSTYVRVYGTKLNDGPGAYGVEALLYGSGPGGALPGSPLRAVNGAQTIIGNTKPNRADVNGGWLFQLPNSWINAGTITLNATVDPRRVWNDPSRGNNSSSKALTFTRKAPVCIVTIPVRSHGPAANNSSPNVSFARDMVRRLWPVSDVWLYHQDSDVAELQARFGIPPWEYGPYEIPDDSWKIMLSLTARDLFSDDPDRCDDADARTHYIGIVSPQTPTGNDNVDAGTNGSGRVDNDQAWVKLPRDDYDRYDIKGVRVATLPHELAHNYGRAHVNCGGPDDPDAGYPYKDSDGQSCTLDNRDQNAASTYFGFDTAHQKPIKPTDARDLLSYTCNDPATCTPRWTSDYTWRALFNGINTNGALEGSSNRTTASANNAAVAPARLARLADANAAVLITGAITTTTQQGALSYGWVYPSGAVGNRLLAKWQTHVAPTVAQLHTQDDAANYHLRLLDAGGGVLDDRAVTLAFGDLHNDQAVAAHDGDGVGTFALTMPAPSGKVAQVQLMANTTVLASLAPGGSAPAVSIISPAGGETADDKLTLSWRASDPDPNDKLLFTVQYSPDNGQTWRVLLSDIPNPANSDTATIDLTSLSGVPASTTGGLIRVAASDGYNTSIAVSQPFTVPNRAPEVAIDAPGSAPVPAGQTVLLRGGATDVEDGGLGDDALRWTLNGADVGSGAQQAIEGLAPGSYTLGLTARDSAGRESTATSTLTVAPLAIPAANAPTLDGTCDDAAYAGAVRVPLAPFNDGSGGQAFAQLVRTGDSLWACFVGMNRTRGKSPGTLAVLRIDTDNNRSAAPDAKDRAFTLDEGGVLSSYVGDGSVFVANASGGQGQVSVPTVVTMWNAEIRIDASALGGMNHVVGLEVEQARVATASDAFAWPQRAAATNPSTWATALLGDAAQISGIAPQAALVGSGDTVVTITGSGFVAGATALWNNATRPTTVVDATTAQITLSAADLAAAGTGSITLVNAGVENAPLGSLPFDVLNPTPQITQLGLSNGTLMIAGSNFVAGAQIQVNGIARAATVNNSGQAQAALSGDELASAEGAEVTVLNPGPGGGVSNVARLLANAPAPGKRTLYLPLTQR